MLYFCYVKLCDCIWVPFWEWRICAKSSYFPPRGGTTCKRFGSQVEASSSMVHDGVIINYPSDRKPPSCLPGRSTTVSDRLVRSSVFRSTKRTWLRSIGHSQACWRRHGFCPWFSSCLSCIGGCVIARVALKRPVDTPAHAKQRAFLREEGVNNLSSGDEEANMSASSDNCGV